MCLGWLNGESSNLLRELFSELGCKLILWACQEVNQWQTPSKIAEQRIIYEADSSQIWKLWSYHTMSSLATTQLFYTPAFPSWTSSTDAGSVSSWTIIHTWSFFSQKETNFITLFFIKAKLMQHKKKMTYLKVYNQPALFSSFTMLCIFHLILVLKRRNTLNSINGWRNERWYSHKIK